MAYQSISWLRNFRPTSLAALATLVVLVALLTLLSIGSAQAKEKITWGVVNYPPHWIVDGPDKNHGTMQEILALLKTRLSAYEHEEVDASVPRIIQEIKNGKLWCWVGPFKTPERMAFAAFSLPIGMRSPDQIIIKKDRQAEFERFGPLSLETLMSHSALRTSFQRERAYSAATHALMIQHPPAHFHVKYVEPIKMLLHGRIDYLIEYPPVALYQAKELGRDGTLIALPFKEMLHNEFNRVMCPNTAHGMQLIDQINAFLRTERPTSRYRKILEKWSDQETIKEIRRLYDSEFLNAE